MTRRTAGSLALLALAACGPSYVPRPPLETPPPAPTTVALDEGLDTPPVRAPRDTSTPAPWTASFVQKIDEKYFREFDATLLAPTGEIVTVGRGRLRVHGPDGATLRSASVPSAAAIGFTRPDQLTVVHEGGLLHFSWPGMVRTTTKIDDEIRAASIVGRRIALSLGDVFSEHRRVRVISLPEVPAGATATAAAPKVIDWFDVPARDVALRLSPDGGKLAVVRRKEVMLRDVVGRREIMRYPSDDYLDGAAFSPDGQRLLIGADTPEEIRAADGGALVAHDFSGSVDGVAFVGNQPVVIEYRQIQFLGEGGATLELRDATFSARGDVVCGQSDEEHYRCLALAPSALPKLAALPANDPPPEPPIPPHGRFGRPAPPPPLTAPPGYSQAWTTPTKGTTRIRMAPKGDALLSWTDWSTIAIHDIANGKVLRTAAVCRGHDYAYGFAGPAHFVGICEDHVVRYGWPSFAEQARLRLPKDMNSGAMGAGHFAVDVEDKPQIVIYALATMKPKVTFQTDGVVIEDSMVMSEDGKVLAFSTKSGVWIYDLTARKPTKIMGSPRGDLLLSPQGDKLLVIDSSLQELSTKDGAQLRAWTDSHIYSAAYAGTKVAARGFDGFTVLSGSGGRTGDWVDGFDGQVVGHDDGTVCVSGRTNLACFKPKPATP